MPTKLFQSEQGYDPSGFFCLAKNIFLTKTHAKSGDKVGSDLTRLAGTEASGSTRGRQVPLGTVPTLGRQISPLLNAFPEQVRRHSKGGLVPDRRKKLRNNGTHSILSLDQKRAELCSMVHFVVPRCSARGTNDCIEIC